MKTHFGIQFHESFLILGNRYFPWFYAKVGFSVRLFEAKATVCGWPLLMSNLQWMHARGCVTFTAATGWYIERLWYGRFCKHHCSLCSASTKCVWVYCKPIHTLIGVILLTLFPPLCFTQCKHAVAPGSHHVADLSPGLFNQQIILQQTGHFRNGSVPLYCSYMHRVGSHCIELYITLDCTMTISDVCHT